MTNFGKKKLLISLVLAFIIIMPFVLGANLLDQIFAPFKGIDVGATYSRYAAFIDAVLYFWLFVALTKFVFKDKFKDATGVPIVIGIILAIGMCIFELNTQFNIGKLSWFAALIFFIILGAAIFNTVKNFGGNSLAALSLSFLILYALINWAAPALLKWINQVGWLSTLFSILFILSIIGLIMGITDLVKGIKTGEWSINKTKKLEKDNEDTTKYLDQKDKSEIKKEKKAAEKIANLERDHALFDNKLQELQNLESQLVGKDTTTRQEQIKYLEQLKNILQGSMALQKTLKNIYDNLDKPEYNDENRAKTKEIAQKLDTYLNSLSNTLTILHRLFEETSKNSEEITKLMQNEKNARKIFDKDNANVEQMFQNILNPLKTLDPFAYSEVLKNQLILNKKLQNYFSLKKIIKQQSETIETVQKEILEKDKRIIDYLNKAIVVSTKKGDEDLGKFTRAVNLFKNVPNAGHQIDEAFNNNFFDGLSSAINSGYKYLSSNSLTQIYQDISDIYQVMPKTIELIKQRNNAYTIKTNEANQYKQISDSVIINIKEETKTLLNRTTIDHESDITELARILAALNTDVSTWKNTLTGHTMLKLNLKDTQTIITTALNKIVALETTELPRLKTKNITYRIKSALSILKTLFAEVQTDLNKPGLKEKEYSIIRQKAGELLTRILTDLQKETSSAQQRLVELKQLENQFNP